MIKQQNLPVVIMEHLGYKVGNRFLLRDLNWQVHCGENWLIFGLNGSGKTTLLSILGGYQANTHGSLQVLGYAYTEASVLEQRRAVGLVSSSFFERYYNKEISLDVVLSARCGSLGLCEQLTEDDIIDAKMLLTDLGLKRKMHYPYAILSKGEKQEVLLARALLNRPKLLLLDEPCAGLDFIARSRFLGMLEVLEQATEITILYVTHALEEITAYFDHCFLLQQGQMVAAGLMEEVFTSDNLSRLSGASITLVREHGCYRGSTPISSSLQHWYGR